MVVQSDLSRKSIAFFNPTPQHIHLISKLTPASCDTSRSVPYPSEELIVVVSYFFSTITQINTYAHPYWMLLKSITMRPALPSSLHADPSHSSLDDLCTQSLQFDHQNPESPEPQVGTPLNRTAPASFRSAATSASSFGLDLFSAFETGLRLASAVTSSSFHLANNINSATAHFADRSMSLYSHAVIHLPHRLSTRAGITATAEATSTKMGSVVECLDLDDEWHKTVQVYMMNKHPHPVIH